MNTDNPAPNGTDPTHDADVQANKDVAAFSYVWVMAFVVYFAKRDSAFARFHSKQAIVLCFLTALWIVPLVGHFLTLFVVLGMLYGFINASQGLWGKVPVAGSIAKGELRPTEIVDLLRDVIKTMRAAVRKNPTHATPSTPSSSPTSNDVDKTSPPRLP